MGGARGVAWRGRKGCGILGFRVNIGAGQACMGGQQAEACVLT